MFSHLKMLFCLVVRIEPSKAFLISTSFDSSQIKVIDAVGAADDVVVLPTVAVELLPGACPGIDRVLDVRVVPVRAVSSVLHEADPIAALRPFLTSGRRVAR